MTHEPRLAAFLQRLGAGIRSGPAKPALRSMRGCRPAISGGASPLPPLPRRLLQRFVPALLAAVLGVAAPAAAASAPALPPLPPVAPDLLPLKLAEIYADFYTVPQVQVERLVRAGLATDDVSVTCFVAVAGPSPVTTLAIQRMQRASWAEIMTAIGVPARALIPVTRSSRPAPRFAALLRRLAAAPDTPAALGDGEVREIVQLKVAVEYFGLEPADVAAWREAGVAASRILLAHYFAGGAGPTGRKLQRVQGSIRVPGL